MAGKELSSEGAKKGGMGCGSMLIFIIVLMALIGYGGNEALGYYSSHCQEQDIIDCFLNSEEEEEPEGAVSATGKYTYKDYSVTVTMNIPLDGGNVTGNVSGACDGVVKGSFNGQDKGVISGTMSGSCDPFFVKIPASATYNGVVNKDTKSVPISFSGQGAGVTHTGSMSLSY